MDHKTPIISNGAVASDDKFVDDPDDSCYIYVAAFMILTIYLGDIQ